MRCRIGTCRNGLGCDGKLMTNSDSRAISRFLHVREFKRNGVKLFNSGFAKDRRHGEDVGFFNFDGDQKK